MRRAKWPPSWVILFLSCSSTLSHISVSLHQLFLFWKCLYAYSSSTQSFSFFKLSQMSFASRNLHTSSILHVCPSYSHRTLYLHLKYVCQIVNSHLKLVIFSFFQPQISLIGSWPRSNISSGETSIFSTHLTCFAFSFLLFSLSKIMDIVLLCFTFFICKKLLENQKISETKRRN